MTAKFKSVRVEIEPIFIEKEEKWISIVTTQKFMNQTVSQKL
jgi:hypothetical protein